MNIYKSDRTTAVTQKGTSIRFLMIWFGFFESGSHYVGIASQELIEILLLLPLKMLVLKESSILPT